MKKENFRYLYSFKYKNKEYVYLTSKNCPFYFVEYDSRINSFNYPDINTFKDLYNKFYTTDNILYFDLLENFKKIKKRIFDINFEITPLIRTTTGLVSIAIALSMCGCTQTNDIKPESEPTSIVQEQDKNQEIYEYFKQYNMEVLNKEYDGNDYIFVTDFINSNDKHQITLHTFEEFRKHIGLEFKPNWYDVTRAFQENKNIDEDKKDLIISYINNMRYSKELKDLDLSVLYANAKRMKFKYCSTEELIKTTNRDSVYAYFDVASGTVYLPNDKPLETFEFVHEVLGHGSLAYRKETKNTLTVFDCTNYIMLPTDNRYTGYSMGAMVSEGGANLIAHIATNDYSVSTFYELYEEELRIISELCNISIGELLNHKGIALYDLMHQNNIDTPVEYIFKMDGIMKGQLYCEFSDLMDRLLVDATEETFKSLPTSEQDELIKQTIQIIKDTHLNNKTELSYSYPGGSIDYNFEETANTYEENMNGLRRSK